MSHRALMGLNTSLISLVVSAAAVAQTPAPAAPPSAAPAPVAAPAPATAPAAPAPASTAATPVPPSYSVPPGYMLVPKADGSPQTTYQVQYPQARGALPPGMELPYEEGDPIPPGYKLRSSPRRGLVIAGSVVTGVFWAISVTTAAGNDFDNKTGYLLVPGIGPWLTLAAGGAKDRDCSTNYCNADRSGVRALLTLDGLVQTAGAAMFVAGFAFPRKRLVREDVTISFAPTPLGQRGYGLGAVGTF